jgi:hypothetical protein
MQARLLINKDASGTGEQFTSQDLVLPHLGDREAYLAYSAAFAVEYWTGTTNSRQQNSNLVSGLVVGLGGGYNQRGIGPDNYLACQTMVQGQSPSVDAHMIGVYPMSVLRVDPFRVDRLSVLLNTKKSAGGDKLKILVMIDYEVIKISDAQQLALDSTGVWFS